MYAIDKSVPLPERFGRGRTAIYPFGEMAVGESFLVPRPDAHNARTAVVKWKARHSGWGYATRSESGGLRIWRSS